MLMYRTRDVSDNGQSEHCRVTHSYCFRHYCYSPTFNEHSDVQMPVSWPAHGLTQSQARARCRNIIVDRTVIGDSCFASNSGGDGSSSDDIVEACVNDVQVLPSSLYAVGPIYEEILGQT